MAQMDEQMPSEAQRERLAEVLSLVLIEIRHLGGMGQAQQAADLADVFHELPREMYGWGTFGWDRLLHAVQRYQVKYSRLVFGFDYASLLEDIEKNPDPSSPYNSSGNA